VSKLLDLARAELRSIQPYTPGAYEPGCIRLNANESPWRTPGDTSERGLNVYPPPRPSALQAKLAEYYGIEQRQILNIISITSRLGSIFYQPALLL
jgi:histidinol-phosphate/aromatic aminotransferase/cobyric acid decarboxylase-like protein